MKKTKIDWADSTWNPVTGCLHGCEYCYARRIAHRYGTPYNGTDCHVITGKVKSYEDAVRTGPYPYEFAPTLHRYRLGDPSTWKTPRTIFVCSMADLFGEWVPDNWIREVFAACERAPQHRYLFLTKNPMRIRDLYSKKALPYADNFWFGSTLTTQDDAFTWFRDTPYHGFVSIEPILAPFDAMETEYWPEWVIVGAETGTRKDKVIPEKRWIDDIAEACAENGTPIFMKSSIRELMGDDFRQEFPWGETEKQA